MRRRRAASAVLPARSVKGGLPTVTLVPSPLVVAVPVAVFAASVAPMPESVSWPRGRDEGDVGRVAQVDLEGGAVDAGTLVADRVGDGPEAILTALPSLVPLEWLMDFVRSPLGANPEPPSATVKSLVTALLYEPFVPSAELVAPSSVMTGAFLSTLTPPTASSVSDLAVLSILKPGLVAAFAATGLPARSVKAGLSTVTLAPSPLVVAVSVAVCRRRSRPSLRAESVASKVAVTSTLRQPLALAAGEALL